MIWNLQPHDLHPTTIWSAPYNHMICTIQPYDLHPTTIWSTPHNHIICTLHLYDLRPQKPYDLHHTIIWSAPQNHKICTPQSYDLHPKTIRSAPHNHMICTPQPCDLRPSPYNLNPLQVDLCHIAIRPATPPSQSALISWKAISAVLNRPYGICSRNLNYLKNCLYFEEKGLKTFSSVPTISSALPTNGNIM